MSKFKLHYIDIFGKYHYSNELNDKELDKHVEQLLTTSYNFVELDFLLKVPYDSQKKEHSNIYSWERLTDV